MIPPIAAAPRRHLAAAFIATALAAGALGWCAASTVRPNCNYAVMTGGLGPAQQEALDRGYWQAVASGDCEPPHARWRFWLD
ncbi:hypothetical protein ACFPK5_28800 [Streptomyces beijiangensis]|uniref:hypothetical protein n=1 Tax=Streptomyces beijiangensis TaxID=163361 RepID=UPI00361D7C8D